MSNRLNLQQMRDDELDYVTRFPTSSFLSMLRKLPADSQPELWDRDRLAEFEFKGQRYVAAGSDYRRQRDMEQRESRIGAAERKLEKFNQVKRKKVDVQSLASQVGRMLERSKALKYFEFKILPDGRCEYHRNEPLIAEEARLDGWYLLTTTLTDAPKETISRHYHNLLEAEDAFHEVKTYLEMRPIFHYRIDRVRNHIRICFIAYYLSARLKNEWHVLSETREAPLILRGAPTDPNRKTAHRGKNRSGH